MVKTGQFTSKCKGDIDSNKTANITLVGRCLPNHQNLITLQTFKNLQQHFTDLLHR